MKPVLKFIGCVLFAGVTIFISCGKNLPDKGPPPAPEPFLDSLTGREFDFNDLTWREIPGWNTNVLIDVDRPDLFFNPSRVLKITIRLDTSAAWLDVFQDTRYSYPAGINFFYTTAGSDFFNPVSGRLSIFPVPENHSLNGTKVSIKVKFP